MHQAKHEHRVGMSTGRSGATVEMRTPGKHGRWAKHEHHVGMVSVETGHRLKYDHRANIGAGRNTDARWV